ncbi:calcium dependent phosphoinositide phospholipase C [Aureococcus anophagefferens]|nr:calcium dependent phosphoinositide phospholipase C [Aureococcus anophagefferens]
MLPCEPYARFSDSPVRSTPRAHQLRVVVARRVARPAAAVVELGGARGPRVQSPLKSKSSALDLRRDFDLELSDGEEDRDQRRATTRC